MAGEPKIIGVPFDRGVKEQIEIRQEKLGTLQKSPEFNQVFNSATSWAKLSSGVSVSDPNKQQILAERLNISVNDIANYNLAKNLVLFGGIFKDKQQLDPFTSNYGLEGAYGFLSDSGQGFRPMPGITSVSSTYKNNGTLRESVIEIKCFTRKQFEAIEAIYLRLGYHMILEWGHTDYFNNEGIRESITQHSVLDLLFSGDILTPEKIRNKLINNRSNTSYNYDGIVGRVKNFNWVLNKDLSYNITLYLTSVGDIIDSLKINTGVLENKITVDFTKISETIEGIENLTNVVSNVNVSDLNKLFFSIYRSITDNLDLTDPNALSQETKDKIEELNKLQTVRNNEIPNFIAETERQIDLLLANIKVNLEPEYTIDLANGIIIDGEGNTEYFESNAYEAVLVVIESIQKDMAYIKISTANFEDFIEKYSVSQSQPRTTNVITPAKKLDPFPVEYIAQKFNDEYERKGSSNLSGDPLIERIIESYFARTITRTQTVDRDNKVVPIITVDI